MQNLFIAGIKHSGKTTFARLLAKRLELESVDSDDLVLRRIAPLSIREYYAKEGKESFMRTELDAIKEFVSTQESAFIMSLGGGASDNSELIEYIRENGKLIYLRRKEKEMLPVILKHGIPAFLDPEDLEGSFHRLYQKRDGIYRTIADKTVDMGCYRDREETLESLIEQLEDIIDER